MKKPAATRQKEKTFIEQLSQAELVEMVLGLQKIIEELQEKLAIATGKGRTTSQSSSKPPSTDLFQKPEKPTVKPEADQKKKPGGQPGHQEKTRKGFGRVDRTEIGSPDICLSCGSKELSEVINIHRQQVASLAAKPIEVVEYHIQSCKCLECGAVLVPKLGVGALVVRDNLPAEKMASIAPMIEAFGASIINLSRYSFDFNPIELWWLQLKSFVRKFSPTTAKMIDTLIAGSLDLIDPQHLKNWFTKCCYCHL